MEPKGVRAFFMEIIILLALVGIGFSFYFHYKNINRFERIEFQLGTPQIKEEKILQSPNQIPKDDPNLIELTEENMFSVPPDVKVEVEGGDMVFPGDFPVVDNKPVGTYSSKVN